jgi:hypothetical protein
MSDGRSVTLHEHRRIETNLAGVTTMTHKMTNVHAALAMGVTITV